MEDDDAIDEFAGLEVLATDPARQIHLLNPANVKLAARLQLEDLARYVLLLDRLTAWPWVGQFRSAVTRRRGTLERSWKANRADREFNNRLAEAEKRGKAIVNANHPREVARAFRDRARPHIVNFAAEWFEHRGSAYSPLEGAVVRAALADWMETEAVNSETGFPLLVNKRAVDDAMDALKSLQLVPSTDAAPPIWLTREPGDPEPRDLLSAKNGLVDVNTAELLPHTARYFNLIGLPYEYNDPVFTLPPYEWHKFLNSIWPPDEGGQESQDVLQEWFGLMLTTETRYQKMLLLLGPGRSGKGTIVRTLSSLIGHANVANTSLNDLGRPFGLQGLIGKSAMIVSDMRVGRNADIGVVTEAMLNLVGEDRRAIQRKYLPDYTGGLFVRLMLVGNLKLILPDQSGALAMRYVPLILNKSFYGREDHELQAKLEPELPGILLWAMEGLRRLRRRGRFVQTGPGEKLLRSIRTHASPLKMFLAERCVLGPSLSVEKEVLFDAFESWALDSDVRDGHDMVTFARDLYAASDDAISNYRPERADGTRPRMFAGVALRPE